MKLMKSGTEARQAMLSGAAKMAAAVGSTLGPSGHNVGIHNVAGIIPTITKDGVTVAREIVLPDPFEDYAAQVLKDASQRTVMEAGDGTTTSCLLAEALFRLGTEMIDSGKIKLHEFQRTCEAAAKMACDEVDKLAIPLRGELVERVASLAANNDPVIGKIVAEAVRAAGQTGIVTIQDSKDWNTTVEIVEGMSIPAGYMSPYFGQSPSAVAGVQTLDNPHILVAGFKLSRFTDNLRAFLEAVVKSGRPLVVLCADSDGPFLATMVMSAVGGVPFSVVRIPGLPEEKNGILSDFALVTGSRVSGQDLGMDEQDLKTKDLGRCGRAVISKDRCVLTVFNIAQDEINKRVAYLLKQSQEEQDIVRRESLERRIARLTTGIVTIKVGASSDSELRQKKARIEDSLLATRCALDEGVVPGGGMTYLDLASKMELGEDYNVLFGTVLCTPYDSLCQNSGKPPSLNMNGATRNVRVGYDFARGEWGDMIEFGIIDPAKVVKAAIRNSFSAAATLAATDHVIVMEKK